MRGMKEHTISVRLSEKTHFRLQNLADEYGLNMSSMLAYLVNERFLSLGLASMSPEKVEPVQAKSPGTDEYYAQLSEQFAEMNADITGKNKPPKQQKPVNTYSNRYKKKSR